MGRYENGKKRKSKYNYILNGRQYILIFIGINRYGIVLQYSDVID